MKNISKILIAFIILCSFDSFSQLSYSLSNKFWRLKYANIAGKEYVFNSNNDNAPTFQFSGGSIRGNGGCNAYHTKFTINSNSVDIGNIMSTKMSCNELYLDERIYFEALAQLQILDYSEGSNELKFTNQSGDQLIFFTQFTRSGSSFAPPPPRKIYREESSSEDRPYRVKNSKSVKKLSKKELARQKLLEKKLNSKRGSKLTKKERRELMALQSKEKKGKNSKKNNEEKPKKGKKGKLTKKELAQEKKSAKKGKKEKKSTKDTSKSKKSIKDSKKKSKKEPVKKKKNQK